LNNINQILVGPASKILGSRLRNYGFKVINVEHRIFPDNESYIRIPVEVKGLNVAILQSTYPPQDKHLLELLFTVDAVKENGAKKIIVIVPYLAYARQDSIFKPGEAVSLRTIIKVMEHSGISTFVTVNIHKADRLKWFNIPTSNLSAVQVIAERLKEMTLKNPLILAPDKGAISLAEEASSILKADYSYFEKTRDRNTGLIKTMDKKLDVSGRDVIIIDDIISSGSTIVNVAKIASQQGASKIIATCIHPLLAEGASEKMMEAGVSKIIGTDCIEGTFSEVSIAPILAEYLRTLP
jgi:ribose-phosphate pyrophosphokinase